jgi:hypothetical protein
MQDDWEIAGDGICCSRYDWAVIATEWQVSSGSNCIQKWSRIAVTFSILCASMTGGNAG